MSTVVHMIAIMHVCLTNTNFQPTTPLTPFCHILLQKINRVASFSIPPKALIGLRPNGYRFTQPNQKQVGEETRKNRKKKKQPQCTHKHKKQFLWGLGIVFSGISVQSTLHNRAEAQIVAHTNNEGIWRTEKVILLQAVKGHQLLDNTRIKDAGYTWTYYSVRKHTHTGR